VREREESDRDVKYACVQGREKDALYQESDGEGLLNEQRADRSV